MEKQYADSVIFNTVENLRTNTSLRPVYVSGHVSVIIPAHFPSYVYSGPVYVSEECRYSL